MVCVLSTHTAGLYGAGAGLGVVGVAGGTCFSSGAELQGLTTGVLGEMGVVGSTWGRTQLQLNAVAAHVAKRPLSPPSSLTKEPGGEELYLGSLQVDVPCPLLLGAPPLPLVVPKMSVSTLRWSGVQPKRVRLQPHRNPLVVCGGLSPNELAANAALLRPTGINRPPHKRVKVEMRNQTTGEKEHFRRS